MDACKRVYRPRGVPAATVTDKRLLRDAIPEISSLLTKLLEEKLYSVTARSPHKTSPLKVNVPPLGASVPSMVVAPLVVLTVPLPVSVPDFHA